MTSFATKRGNFLSEINEMLRALLEKKEYNNSLQKHLSWWRTGAPETIRCYTARSKYYKANIKRKLLLLLFGSFLLMKLLLCFHWWIKLTVKSAEADAHCRRKQRIEHEVPRADLKEIWSYGLNQHNNDELLCLLFFSPTFSLLLFYLVLLIKIGIFYYFLGQKNLSLLFHLC